MTRIPSNRLPGSMPAHRRGNLHRAESLQEHIGKRLPFYNTLKKIFDSLGVFPHGFTYGATFVPHSMRDVWGRIPFRLNPEGQRFFKELFNLEGEPNADAFLIMYCGGNPAYSAMFDGVKRLPVGIIFQDPVTKQPYFFNLTKFLTGEERLSQYAYHIAVETAPVLFPNISDNLTYLVEKSLATETNVGFLHVPSDVHDLFGFTMLTLDEPKRQKTVFSSTSLVSIDFQMSLYQIRERIRNACVVEIGPGTGVNLLHALRFGARSVWVQDLSEVYCLLSEWNLQYAEDTGQIPAGSSVRAKVVCGNGLAGAPDAQIYLFNAPGISLAERITWKTQEKGERYAQSLYIEQEDFGRLFADLQTRLTARRENRALIRILPSTGTFSPDRMFPMADAGTVLDLHEAYMRKDPAQLHPFFDFRPSGSLWDHCKRVARAHVFLRQQGLEFSNPRERFDDIFLIRPA
ncbi:MAG: hypothetical protein HQ596_04135 [Candidatus Saganbacteria bacterium]|nr:hypothetical protein [Candidatus Saganbacteria bacterium]